MPADPDVTPTGSGDFAMRAVSRVSLADAVHDQLRAAILSGDQAPGSVLPAEMELAAQAGVNRQAVREALQRLRQVGLIEIVQGGGAHVLDWRSSGTLSVMSETLFDATGALDAPVVESIFRLRLVTLVDASRLAAERHSEVADARLAGLVATLRDENANPLPARAMFWDTIAVASGNIAYQLINNTQANIARRLPPDVIMGLLQGSEIADSYDALARAVAAGDPNGAAAAADRILFPSVALFASMPSSNPRPGVLPC